MRKLVKHIELQFIHRSRGTNPFDLLLKLDGLRSLNIDPHAFNHLLGRDLEAKVQCFVDTIKDPLKRFYLLQGGEGHQAKVTEIFQITFKRCAFCVELEQQRKGYSYRHPSAGMPTLEICKCGKLRKRRKET